MAMDLPHYVASQAIRTTNPYDYYKALEQATINAQWTNTTTVYTIKEQATMGNWTFNDIEVHLNHMIAESSISRKNGNDFRNINFQSLDHTITRGLYYLFDDSYWLTTFTDEVHLLTKNIVVRRCNNVMKWKNPSTGVITSYPCVLDYDDSSPQNQKVKDIITPNNGIIVIVQGNADTTDIYTNQRFIFNGRPFKIAGYNDYMNDQIDDDVPNILYFDTYLDEISPYDDLINGVADNSQPATDIGTTSGTQTIPTGEASIVIAPYVETITQGQNVEIHAYVQDASGTATTDTVTCNPSGATVGNYKLTSAADNRFVLTNVHYDPTPLTLTFTSGTLTNTITVKLKGLY